MYIFLNYLQFLALLTIFRISLLNFCPYVEIPILNVYPWNRHVNSKSRSSESGIRNPIIIAMEFRIPICWKLTKEPDSLFGIPNYDHLPMELHSEFGISWLPVSMEFWTPNFFPKNYHGDSMGRISEMKFPW